MNSELHPGNTSDRMQYQRQRRRSTVAEIVFGGLSATAGTFVGISIAADRLTTGIVFGVATGGTAGIVVLFDSLRRSANKKIRRINQSSNAIRR